MNSTFVDERSYRLETCKRTDVAITSYTYALRCIEDNMFGNRTAVESRHVEFIPSALRTRRRVRCCTHICHSGDVLLQKQWSGEVQPIRHGNNRKQRRKKKENGMARVVDGGTRTSL